MTRVIFGSSGCIGKSLCQLTASKSIDHLALDSSKLNLLSTDAASKINGIVNDGDDVIILAALTPEKGDAVDTTAANVVMMQNILAGLKTVEVRHVIYISSDAVYSQDIESIKSSTPKSPSRLYGHAHLVREEMLKHAIDSGHWTIIRPCAVYGHNDTHNAYGVMRFWREAVSNYSITLFGNGEEHRDHVHADDVAAIIDQALALTIHGEFNASSGQSISFSSLATMIKAKMSKPVTIKSVARQVSVTHRYIDNADLLAAFPNHHPRLIKFGLDDLLEQHNHEL